MALAPGTRIGHFLIADKLGEGGMGEVFRATDTKLGRAVALKILPAEMARDPERLARFQREARAVAALNHPNIVTIYSVEESDGIHFLTMELIEGQSLAEIITADGLPVDRLASIATALADALAAAHEKGIVHRDLKPANVMMTLDGRVKVLDFGLAKEIRASDPSGATLTAAGHTQMGIVMGTPAYMSPEQIAGRAVDHRTDIFSLGILLYQMATGQRPFEGASSIELASAILRDTPRPLADLRSDVPADLARLIRRCLEKDASRRVQTMRDVGNELRELGSTWRPASAGPAESAKAEDGFWIAVQPFKYSGGNADLAALAEGLSEEISTGFSRFSYLRVIAPGTPARQPRYVLEGSIRHAASTVRVTVQLVDTTTGAHLWAETYERRFQPDQMFALQDDLIPRIVSTCADMVGVIARSISEAVRGKDSSQLTPYEALMRSLGYHFRLTPDEHAEARAALERAVEQAPANPDCRAMLSWMYSDEHAHGFNVRPGSLDRALAAARRAVDLAPSNHLAHQALARAHFFRKEIAACRTACDRALALNPLDGSNEAIFLICFSGDWDRGSALVRRAMDLNPHHPGWYRWMLAIDEYRQANYRAAVEEGIKANVPGIFWSNVLFAAAYGQLGELDAAGTALRDLLAQKADFAGSAREAIGTWFDPALAEHVIDGLRKAGLAVDAGAAAAPSGAMRSRVEDSLWVAVEPFKARGAHGELDAFAEGLSEEIVTGLSRFSYLKVIAGGVTGREGRARYVMEGSVRQAGSQLRIAAQLVDTGTGAHLWADTYNRAFQPDAIFDLQDELVPRIVSTVADMNGVLRRSMSDTMRGRRPDELSPYEAVLRGFGLNDRVTPEEHADVRDILEHAVRTAPGLSDGWALLSLIYCAEYHSDFNLRPDPLGRALDAARRAVAAAPASQLAHYGLASAMFFLRDIAACRHAADRAVALNPMDGATVAHIGIFLAYSGDWARGCALLDRAMQLNPQHPGWYWFGAFFNGYRQGDYQAALDAALKVNMPGYFFAHAALAAAYGQLGQKIAARGALAELLSLKPDGTIEREYAKWFDASLVEHLMDGLRKAGLDLPG